MKKRILIIMPSMFAGGAERSLLGLLEHFDYEKVEVSLFLYRHEGEFLQYVPNKVKLLPEIKQYGNFDVPIIGLLFSKRFFFGVSRILAKFATFMHGLIFGEKRGVWMAMQYISRFLQPLLPPIDGEYDMGIMFLGIADTLVNKVNAKVKLAWSHTDYDTLFPDKAYDLSIYDKVDWVVSVSKDCNNKLRSYYPCLNEKSIVIENILPTELMRLQAEEFDAENEMPNDGAIRILSVGRFCTAKNFDNIPNICCKIREMGINVKWYLIGYGGCEELIRNRIRENNAEEFVIILGKRTNPYPYIRACNVYIQPSRYEGKCVAVREAQMLGKPVIITDYATSAAQLSDGIDGVIVPMDNDSCAKSIASLLKQKKMLERIAEGTKKYDYSNRQEIEKLYRLIK